MIEGRSFSVKTTATLTAIVLLVLVAVPVLASQVVTPEFNDHEIPGAVLDFTTDETILGDHSVEMTIPKGVIGDQYNLGLDVDVRHSTGRSRRLGLALYDDISFKAKLGDEFHGWLYNGLILYDKTNDLWVSLMPDGTTIGDPDVDGWRTVTPGRPDINSIIDIFAKRNDQ